MSTIKNLIFDLDNTLYDFSTIWKESNKLVYKYLKYDKIASYEEFFRHYKAINNILVDEVLKGNMKLREIRNKRLKLTLEEFGIILTEEDCNIYYEKQFDFIIESIKPNEEVNLWLSRLCKKYKMILLTNGKSYEQREKLAKLDLENLFELYISGETHISKPKAEAFINVLEKENIVASETVMIGDSLHYDINPANKLGMKTCLVERKWHFDDELENYTGYKVKDIIQFFRELETNKL